MAFTPRVGIGRGRGVILNRKADYSAPISGLKEPEEKASPMDHLKLLIDNMLPDGNDFEVAPVKKAFMEAATTKDQLNAAVQLLISRCLREEKFASCAARLCAELSDISVDSLNLRTAFLGCLQANYKQKEELRKEQSQTKWMGCVALLSQALLNFKMPDDSPLAAMMKPTVESLLICLEATATDKELECAATQILGVGNILVKHGEADDVKRLNDAVYDIIVAGRGSEATRRKLIDVVEVLNRKPI